MSREDQDTLPSFAAIIDDLLRGEQHNRQTVQKKTGKSLSAVDRWLKLITSLPTAQTRKAGRTTWVFFQRGGQMPTKPATIGACIATSLAALFEGTENERNLRDARDHMLKARGDHYEDLDRKFVFAPRGGEYALPESAAFLDEIIEALLRARKLSFRYRHNDQRDETLLLEPLSLLVFDHQFYVLCRRSDESLYCYRFARMSEVDATSKSFAYPSKNEYDPRRVLEPGFGVHLSGAGPIHDVEIELREPWASFAKKHRWHTSQDVSPHATGGVLLKLRVRHCRELETWILGFGEHATVTAPVQLREAIAGRVAKMAANYQVMPAMRPSVAKAKKRRKGVKSARKTEADGPAEVNKTSR